MVGPGNYPLTIGIAPCRFVSAPHSNMLAKKDVALSSAAKPSDKGVSDAPIQGSPLNSSMSENFVTAFVF